MRRRRRPTLHHAVKDKRVTVLGPVKQPEMDFMSHRGGGAPMHPWPTPALQDFEPAGGLGQALGPLCRPQVSSLWADVWLRFGCC